MEEEEQINIPVTILTGFLGAGKTTFLNHLLEENTDTRYAIIENEYGEAGIDNELVLRPAETIVELNNGCLCCTLNENLYDILNELFDHRNEIDEIIIEATGVADPTGLAEPFIVHPLIRKHFPLTSIICIIDAELVEMQMEETEEAINQIAFSDILLINKIDLVSENHVSRLENILRRLNPLARIASGHIEEFPKIAYHMDHRKLEELLLKSQKENEPHPGQLSFPIQRPHSHHHHVHTEEIQSQTFTFTRPFNFELLRRQLFIYLTFQAKGLYRIKGLICLEDYDHQYIIQSVGKRLDFQEKKTWKRDEQKKSVIVFIGKRLQRQGLERILNQCISNAYRSKGEKFLMK